MKNRSFFLRIVRYIISRFDKTAINCDSPMTSIILRLISTPTNDISLKPRNTAWYKVFIYYTSVEGGYTSIYGYSGFREKILSSGMRQTAAIVVYDVVVNGLRLVPYMREYIATKCLQLRYIKSVYVLFFFSFFFPPRPW